MMNEDFSSERLGRSTVLRIILCAAILILHSSYFTTQSFAQLNTDRLLTIGRSALYYEDYVLSIQYFNQAITAKPYLYEPWFFRGVAKYYLDDFTGAEADCTEAIQRNPYVTNIYELRGLTRIRQKKYDEAIDDYTRALKYDPENRTLWHNRVLCRIQNKEYSEALAELDTMQSRWSHYAQSWSMRADVYMQMNDTVQAVEALQRSLDIDPYDGQTWAARSIISLSREEWPEAEKQLDEAVRLLPRHASNYINRALARFHQNNLRGAMADYDMALDLEPDNFLGHYNRGLLRAQVGDDNRAITDFDFVLRLEPYNLLALFNRAVLLDKTGDLHAAIRDYTKVIDEFPNFWTGLQFRAACYRRLGMNKQAELDEFALYKAQLYKHLFGTQPRLDPDQIRKRSDIDPDKYNQLVVEDDQEPEREYQSDYRGRVQNRRVAPEFQPMFALSMEQPEGEIRATSTNDSTVEQLNRETRTRTIYISSRRATLTSDQTADYFAYIDTLGHALDTARPVGRAIRLLLVRAVAYTMIQNYEAAVDDLSAYLSDDSVLVLALWQRAVCQSRISQFQASQGTDIHLMQANVLADLNHAIALQPKNPYLVYNRANVYAQRGDYQQAVTDYTEALRLDPYLAEAYYNRGLCYLHNSQRESAIRDLGKAGELGLYDAYSIIKRQQQ